MGHTDKNLYAYCDNNPITRADDSGEFWHVVVGAAVGFASQYVANVVGGLLDGESIGEALKIKKEDLPGLIGATVSGALTATGIPAGGLMLANAAINTTSYALECEIKKERINPTELVVTVGVGMVFDMGSGGVDGKRLSGILKTANNYIAKSESVKKIAMYTAKRTAVKQICLKATRDVFVSTVVSNNAYNVFKYVRKLCK